MRTSTATFLICAVVSVGTASNAVTAKPETVHYEVKMKSLSSGDMGTKRMYIKGGNMRWESKAANLSLAVIKNKQGTFLVSPFKKTAAKYYPGSNRSNPRIFLPGPTGSPKVFLEKMKAVKRGREKVERETCDVYSYYEPLTDRKCRLWISVKSGKPVKLVLEGVKSSKDTVVATYTRFVLGGPLSDSLFELPKGYAVRPMPQPKLTTEQRIPRTNAREPA